MEDKEFVVYMMSNSNKVIPSGIRYINQKEAHDAAVRLSERENIPCYVIEVVMVCNTIEVIEPPKGETDG